MRFSSGFLGTRSSTGRAWGVVAQPRPSSLAREAECVAIASVKKLMSGFCGPMPGMTRRHARLRMPVSGLMGRGSASGRASTGVCASRSAVYMVRCPHRRGRPGGAWMRSDRQPGRPCPWRGPLACADLNASSGRRMVRPPEREPAARSMRGGSKEIPAILAGRAASVGGKPIPGEGSGNLAGHRRRRFHWWQFRP